MGGELSRYDKGPIPGAPARVPGTPSSVPSGGPLKAPSSYHLHDIQGRFVTGGFGWEWTRLVEFFNLPDDFVDSVLNSQDEKMKELRAQIEDYARENAPWNDQTGNARRGLKAIYIRRGDNFEINLGHTVRYGYYLEHHNGGMYAIIVPTLRRFAPQMMDIARDDGKSTADNVRNELIQ